jgi:hypothetical protein
MMMEATRTSETSVDNYFTRQYIPEDSELYTRRRENLKSHISNAKCLQIRHMVSMGHVMRMGNYTQCEVMGRQQATHFVTTVSWCNV